MSENYRPSVGNRPPMAGRMPTTGHLPGVMPVYPNSYGLVPGQQSQFFPHTPYALNLQNAPNRIPLLNAVPGPMLNAVPGAVLNAVPVPGMYVPVKAGPSSFNMDPTKLLEEQRRLEKERNFQLQQQRLKQFTVAGKKGSLNADNLIDSMFGKVPPKQTQADASSSTKPVFSESSEALFPNKPVFEPVQPSPVQPCVINQEVPHSIPLKTNKMDKKDFDAMMRDCTDLNSGPQKAHTFTKPVVRELAPAAHQRSTFTPSNKARDWKNLQGFEEVFIANKPRFPDWCKKESVPELYRQIEAIVTNNGSNEPDTKLLFPILLSSGLPHQTLGQIWELVNQSAPGCLTVEEMYAALAVIAVTQAGHQVKTTDILHHLPSCPVPQLQCFSSQSQEAQKPHHQQPSFGNPVAQNAAAIEAQKTHQASFGNVAAPATAAIGAQQTQSGISLASRKVVPANIVVSGSGFLSSPDDDFDDFKSATPTAVNFSLNTPWTQDDSEFDDFKQAPVTTFTTTDNIPSIKPPTDSTTAMPLPIPEATFPMCVPVKSLPESKPSSEAKPPEDLMSPDEDKYSVFRSLQQTSTETEEWGAFSSVGCDARTNSEVEDSSQSNTPTFPSEFLSNPAPLETKSDYFSSGNDLFGPQNTMTSEENDDFGDFLHAEVPSVSVVTAKLEKLTTNSGSSNFADFANFKEPEFHPVPPAQNSQTDDEFGDFASSLPVHGKPDLNHEFGDFTSIGNADFSTLSVPGKSELGHDFFFQHVKDNISLAESQSVSSLELGTFDGGGHSGESKSSLSRQGSIPSLDLKNSGVELADNDEFGEFQSPVGVQSSKTPSPSKDLRLNFSSNNFVNTQPFQNTRTTSLIDKYSVIRSEEMKEEDQHISSWLRCLQSSVNILQNTQKIFNQMSCSSVCNEVLKSEEGENYIKDVIEVYKVIRRIAVSSKAAGKQTIPMLDLLKEADKTWNTICGFFAGSILMPEDSSLQFTNAVLTSNHENIAQACGLCLLNINIKSKSRNAEENLKLSYGGRNYHSTCANLWVNCVNPLLPALTLPQLL
ncbi:hypothetical protein JTE90_012215 [Oedothorax gibbosus]|uniref:EH domain-containing protein n=1 Tax=Oedothorax gibbosus TaxID=931172 RepID=A0AAV6TWQ7_9ARAC|nr:hypothetical protein JTE90_012215 [Oedothorax gibbosus]